MKKYKINTFGYGIFYRHARTPQAARQRIVFAIFGRGYEGYEHEYWIIEEVTK